MDEIDAALDRFLTGRKPQDAARASVVLSAGVDADAEAEYRKLAKASGIPIDSVRANKDAVQQQVTAPDFNDMAKRSPALTAYLSSIDNARIAHDDIGALTGVEKAIRDFMDGGTRKIQRPAPKVMTSAEFSAEINRLVDSSPGMDYDTARSLAAQGAIVDNQTPRVGPVRGPAPSISSVIGGLASSIPRSGRQFNQQLSVIAADVLGLDNTQPMNRLRSMATQEQAQTPEFETSTGQGLYAGGISLIRNAPGIAASVVTGSPAPGLAMAGAGSAAPAYSKYRDRGATKDEAASGALLEGGIEVATELLPMRFMVDRLGKAGATEFIKGLIAREVPTEQIATLAQDAVDTAIANPNKTWGEYVKERPGAAYETLLATLVQAGAMGAANTVAVKLSGFDVKAQRAEAAAAQVEQLVKVVEASKLRQRDAESFQQFVTQVAEDGDTPTEFFIDAQVLTNTLNQAGVTMERLAMIAPAVTEQLRAASFIPGADIRVPVAEFAAAGTDITTPLIDHLRESPDAMSRAEAQEFLKAEGDTIRADVEREVTTQAQQSEYQRQVEEVSGLFEGKLKAAGRFRPEVNRAYASMLGNYYVNQAQRAGVPVQEFVRRYGLEVSSKEVTGQQQVEQGAVADVDRAWRDLSGINKLSDFDSTAETKVTGPMDDFVLSREIGKQWAALNVREHRRDDGTVVYSSSLEVGSEGFPKGTGAATTMYLQALNIAKQRGMGWQSEGRGSENAQAIYRRLTEAGVPFKPVDGSSYVDADALSNVDLQAVAQKLAGNRGTFDPSDPNILNQGARANLTFANDITTAPSVIALLDGADLSSFLHESGHFFLEVEYDLATRILFKPEADRSEAERQIIKDMETLLGWFGVKPTENTTAIDEWSMMSLEQRRESHEKFARGFERYTMEGRAPNLELQSIFNRFRAWLVQIYKAMKSLDVTLTDDVRAVMDRMLATNEAIQVAEQARNMGPLFDSPEQSGMTFREYEAYQALGEKATAEAEAKLTARTLADMKWLSRAKAKALKALQAEADELRKETEREVRAEVMAQPIYQVWQFLTGKVDKVAPGTVATEDIDTTTKSGRLRTSLVKESNPDALELLKARRMTSEDGGMHPDIVAEMFPGFDSGDHLIKALAAAPAPAEVIADLTDQRMLERHGDITSDEALNQAADEAVHNEYRARAIAAELKAMQEAMSVTTGKRNTVNVLASAAKEYAAQVVARLKVRDIRPGQYAAAEARSAKLAGKVQATPDKKAKAAPQTFDIQSMAMEAARLLDGKTAAAVIGELTAAGNQVSADLNNALVAVQEFGDRLPELVAHYQALEAKNPGAKPFDLIAQSVEAIRSGQVAQSPKAEPAEPTNFAEAVMHKRNQLINHYAAKAAYDALAKVKAAQRYFRKFDKDIKAIDIGYRDQIDQLLERFDFKPASLKTVDKRKGLAEWVAAQREMGNEPNIPDDLLNESMRKSYKDMTMEEIRGLVDTVKQIEHLGRLKNKLLLARDKRAFDAIASEMAQSIIDNGGKVREVELEGAKGIKPWLEGVAASHRKLSSLFRQMDGGEDAGPMYERIGRTMNERGTMEDVMVEGATVALRKLYAPIMALPGGTAGYRSKLFIPEINSSLTRGGRLAVALNWGNEQNRQRLRDGDKWTDGQVQAILKTLTHTELEFVNGAWEYLDSFWPDISAKELRLTGVTPEKVEAQPFTVTAADGTQVQMRGGYYPLKYDTDRSDRAEQQEAVQVAKEMMQGAFTRATTRRGHTKARAEEVKRAVRKDLNVITQHITQVVHDLAWHEWLIDTNKLLSDDRVVDAIRDHYGPKVLKTMRDGVMGIATADVVPGTDVDKALLLLRSNVTRATMGASVTTAFLQPFGLTQSMVRIGPKHVLRGLARWGGDAARMESSLGWIHEKSDFMRLRSKTFNRELREIRGAVAGKSRAMQVVDGGLFWMMQKMQLVADVPTWIGQYEKSIADGQDEASAVAMADRAVIEAQGAGATKDMAEVQRKHPMLTQFYSYFSVTANLTAEATANTDFRNPRAVAGWLGDMALLLVIPAILPAMILDGLRGGGDDDESMAAKIAKWQLGYLMGTVVGVRELSGTVSGFDYAGPPVARIVGDIGKAGKQTAQGELDEPAVLAYARLIGTAFGIPITQVIRSYKGWKAWDEGETGPQGILVGPPAPN